MNDFNEVLKDEINDNKETEEFVRNVENFLSQRGNRKLATKKGMLDVKNALQKTNLPLTRIVFEHEMKRNLKHHKKRELTISPSISVTISEIKEKKCTLSTQCDIAKNEINQIRNQYIHSLKELKAQLQEIYDKRHQKKYHK